MQWSSYANNKKEIKIFQKGLDKYNAIVYHITIEKETPSGQLPTNTDGGNL